MNEMLLGIIFLKIYLLLISTESILTLVVKMASISQNNVILGIVRPYNLSLSESPT